MVQIQNESPYIYFLIYLNPFIILYYMCNVTYKMLANFRYYFNNFIGQHKDRHITIEKNDPIKGCFYLNIFQNNQFKNMFNNHVSTTPIFDYSKRLAQHQLLSN